MTKPGRGLYKIYVVDPRNSGKVLMDGKGAIAESEEKALLKAGVAQAASEAGLELEQVDIYAELVATFIRPRTDTQKVKIVKDDKED